MKSWKTAGVSLGAMLIANYAGLLSAFSVLRRGRNSRSFGLFVRCPALAPRAFRYHARGWFLSSLSWRAMSGTSEQDRNRTA